MAGPPSRWPLRTQFADLSKGLLTLYLPSLSLLHCTDILFIILSVVCFYYVCVKSTLLKLKLRIIAPVTAVTGLYPSTDGHFGQRNNLILV